MSVPQTKAELLLAIDKNFSKLITSMQSRQTLPPINQWMDTPKERR